MPARRTKRGGFTKFQQALLKELPGVLFTAGDIVKDRAQGLIMEGSSSGRKTKKHRHVASLPGQPPNNDRQHLHDNIETTNPKPLRVLVTSNADYSAALEYGTFKMAARPFMAPAAHLSRKAVVATIRTGVVAAVRKAEGA